MGRRAEFHQSGDHSVGHRYDGWLWRISVERGSDRSRHGTLQYFWSVLDADARRRVHTGCAVIVAGTRAWTSGSAKRLCRLDEQVSPASYRVDCLPSLDGSYDVSVGNRCVRDWRNLASDKH